MIFLAIYIENVEKYRYTIAISNRYESSNTQIIPMDFLIGTNLIISAVKGIVSSKGPTSSSS